MKPEQVRSVGFTGLLFLVLLVLKLTGQIDWSWWWVTAPLWVAPAVVILVLGVLLVGVMLGKLAEGREGSK